MIFFWTIKCPYRRHWIPAGSMFTYFCFGWLFRIIFTSVYLFNQKFNICIIIDSVLWNFCYLLNTNVLVSSKGSTVQKITKIFIFTFIFTFLCNPSLLFVLNEWRQLSSKIPCHVLTLFLLIMQIIFYYKIM